jgi:hypothetical protein
MRTLLTLAVLIVVCGPPARAQDEANPGGPALGGEPAVLVPLEAAPVETSTPAAAPAPLMMPPALPHYYGQGEWPGFNGCAQGCGQGCHGHGHWAYPACDGTTWGACARPRTYHLHLWDGYCYESTRCPACGFTLGSLAHYWCCERRCQCGCECGCQGGSCACGCAGGEGPSHGPAKAEPRPADEPAPVPPAPREEKIDKSVQKKKETVEPKKELPKDLKPPMDPMPKPPMSKEPMPKELKSKEPMSKEPMPKEPMPKEPMPKELKEKTTKKSSRVAPSPRSAGLLDRLFRWPTSGSW